MKRKTSLFLLSLTLVLSMLLSGCGQSQTSAPPSESDDAANPPVVDTVTPPDESETPEDSQPVISDAPEDGADTGEEKADEETSAPSENAPPPDGFAPEQKPAQTQEQATASKPDTTPAPPPAAVTQEPVSTPETPSEEERPPVEETKPVDPPASNTTLSGTTLTLRFGGGEEFTINMYDNDTANKIAEYVGTAAWQLPIYHYDDYDGWESYQYYDIPSRYEIPDGSQSVTSQKAGAVYYSHPNRIILFYQDASISSEYTPVGYIDFSQDLIDAVENNPVVEGWGNKIVQISAGE
jgi:hypothetical protein